MQALLDTRDGKAGYRDIEIIQPMVIPIGPSAIAWQKIGHDPTGPGQDKWWDYTCRHFDTKTGNCGIYEERPQMCRDHGTYYPCATPGCTMEGAVRDIPNKNSEK